MATPRTCISILDSTHQRLLALRWKLSQHRATMTWRPTVTKIVDHMLNFFDSVMEASLLVESGQAPESHLREVIRDALSYQPDGAKTKKEAAFMARNATIEQRAIIAQRLINGAGISNPTDELITAAIAAGMLSDMDRAQNETA